MSERAHTWDLDDTVFSRGGVVRGLGVVKAVIKPSHLQIPTLDQIPELTRQVTNKPITSPFEMISYAAHAKRQLIPGIKKEMEEVVAAGDDNYGNTGRSNKKQWVGMTETALDRAGILNLLTDVFYTPDGVKTAVSKAAAIRELLTRYRKVTHHEDDPRTAVFIACLFPDVDIVLVEYGSTGRLYSSREIDRFPNIKRSARIRT